MASGPPATRAHGTWLSCTIRSVVGEQLLNELLRALLGDRRQSGDPTHEAVDVGHLRLVSLEVGAGGLDSLPATLGCPGDDLVPLP
jgi:hypothetical protein